MADKPRVFEFVIDGFTPDTLPMARLAEYLSDLSLLLGEREHVHFKRVDDGSARLVHTVDDPVAPKVRARVSAARVADSESESRRAFENLDHKLREDRASADLREIADGTVHEPVRLLYFPGQKRHVDPVYGPFNEQGSLRGRIISVGGKQKIVNINIEDGDNVYFCEASRDVALQLAPLMFHHDIRVYGTGRYLRNQDGEWEMKSFRIAQFETLDSRPLAETVERLRGITRKVGLPPDIIARLAALRDEA